MTETVADFRARAEEFIAARYPLRNPDVDDDRVDTISRSRDGHHAMTEAARNFQRELFDELDAPIGLVSSLDVPMPYSKALEVVVLPSKERCIEEITKVIEGCLS